MSKTAKKTAGTATKKPKKSPLDAIYEELHKTEDYKEMVKAGKVPKVRNGVRIG